MTLPLTIIIPVYNRPAALALALRSIARQSALPAEIIVVDDASAPPVAIDPAIATRLPVRLLRHDTNRGAAAARNTGLRAAISDWVGFLDSDDRLLEHSLSARWALVAERVRQGGAARTIFGCAWLDYAPPASPLGIRAPHPATQPAAFAAGCWFSPGSCVFLNRAAVLDVGLEDERLGRFEDVDWFYRLARAGFRLEVLPVVGVAIERRRTNAPVAIEAAARTLLEKWRDAPAVDRRNLESYMDLEMAAVWYFAGDRRRALVSLIRSLLRVPRLSLQLSPGWVRSAATAAHEAELAWFDREPAAGPPAR